MTGKPLLWEKWKISMGTPLTSPFFISGEDLDCKQIKNVDLVGEMTEKPYH